MKIKALLAITCIPVVLGGCVVGDGDDADVTVAPRPVTVEAPDPEPRDVNIQVKTPDIEIKQDPPLQSTTGF